MRFSLSAVVGLAAVAHSATLNRDVSLRAAYFLENNPAGNNLVALHIGSNGQLSSPVKTATHGVGLVGNGAKGPSNLDPLFSQDAVLVAGNLLFAVNPGSHTLSMFEIPFYDPWHPILVGKPADTQGEFPISVTYSDKLNTACVLNGGAKATVSCFYVHPVHGLTSVGSAWPIPILHQTTPPLGPASTASDIVFNPSSTALFVTIKGDPATTPPTPGAIYTISVSHGQVSGKATAHTLPSLILAFSANFLGCDDKLLVTDPVYGAALLSVSPSGAITETKQINVAGQAAICWAVYSRDFNSAYLLDTGKTNITIVDPSSGNIKGELVMDSSVLGALDSASQREWLYVRASDGSVVVVDLNQRKEVQRFDTGVAGAIVGMAVWPQEG